MHISLIQKVDKTDKLFLNLLHVCAENYHRYAMRATFFFVEILKARKSPLEAASRLIRAADKEVDKLTTAMLQEQAAFSYLLTSPLQYRKFCFRLILAGHYFNLSNQVFFFFDSNYNEPILYSLAQAFFPLL